MFFRAEVARAFEKPEGEVIVKTEPGSIVLECSSPCVPGFTYQIAARRDRPFVPRDITMSDQTGSSFMIRNLRVGYASQLSRVEWERGGIKASSLRNRALPSIQSWQDIVMEVENVSESPAVFSVTITGFHPAVP